MPFAIVGYAVNSSVRHSPSRHWCSSPWQPARDVTAPSTDGEVREVMMRRRLATTSTLATGTLLGAMLIIRVVLLPFWRSSRPDEFKDWFRQHAPRIRATMVPLGALAAVTATANALARRSPRAALGAVAAAGVGVVTAVVNEPLNARFV